MRRSALLVGSFLSAEPGRRSVCEDLAERLSGAGWSVLAVSHRTGRLARLLDIASTAWRRRSGYAVAQVDVFSGRAFLWAEVAAWAVRQAGRPFVLTLRGGDLPGFAARWPGRVRRLLTSAAAVTTPSRYLREKLRPYRDDLLLLPNPLDLGAYRFRDRARPAPRLIWLRAFHRVYNPALAVRALARLRQDFPDAHLTMVGYDKGDGALHGAQALALQLGVSGCLALPGGAPHEDVPGWLDGADIFLNTSNIDNTPVSVMEAMACGLCVVSTDVGGMPFLIEHGRDGLLVPPDDPAAMAAAVSHLLNEDGLAGRLSQNARSRVEPFDWGTVLPRWEALLTSAAEGRA